MPLPNRPSLSQPAPAPASALPESGAMDVMADAPARELARCTKKIILLGHFGVGKSSLVQRFVHSMFSRDYQTTIGVKIDKKVVQTPTHEMKMLLWDIEGAEDQTRLPRSYFMGAHGILYVCDVTRPTTFERLEETIPDLDQKSPGASVIVLGNKTDLLPSDELADLEHSVSSPFDFLCSADSGVNVEAAFHDLATRILDQ